MPLTVDGIAAGNTTRGHRFMAPDAFTVSGFDDYAAKLRRARVMLDTQERAAEIRSQATSRTVTAVVPDEAIASISASLRHLDGVRTVTSRGDRVVVTTSNADDVARLLLAERGVHDLEITSAGLEEAFMALTGRTVAEPASDGPPDGIPARVGAQTEEVAR